MDFKMKTIYKLFPKEYLTKYFLKNIRSDGRKYNSHRSISFCFDENNLSISTTLGRTFIKAKLSIYKEVRRVFRNFNSKEDLRNENERTKGNIKNNNCGQIQLDKLKFQFIAENNEEKFSDIFVSILKILNSTKNEFVKELQFKKTNEEIAKEKIMNTYINKDSNNFNHLSADEKSINLRNNTQDSNIVFECSFNLISDDGNIEIATFYTVINLMNKIAEHLKTLKKNKNFILKKFKIEKDKLPKVISFCLFNNLSITEKEEKSIGIKNEMEKKNIFLLVDGSLDEEKISDGKLVLFYLNEENFKVSFSGKFSCIFYEILEEANNIAKKTLY